MHCYLAGSCFSGRISAEPLEHKEYLRLSPRSCPEPRGCPGGGGFRSPSFAGANPRRGGLAPRGGADPVPGRPRSCGSPASRGAAPGAKPAQRLNPLRQFGCGREAALCPLRLNCTVRIEPWSRPPLSLPPVCGSLAAVYRFDVRGRKPLHLEPQYLEPSLKEGT